MGRTVLVIEGHHCYADALCRALDAYDDIDDCRAVTDADTGLRRIQRTSVDAVVIGAHLSAGDSVDAVSAIRDTQPDLPVVLLAADRELEWLSDVARAGADAVLSAEAGMDDLLAAVRSDDDAGYRVRDLLDRAADDIRLRDEARLERRGTPIALTPREREVLGLLAEGVTVKEIARLLGIAVETTRGYVKSLLLKLGARSQLQAVVAAQRLGLLDGDD